jgi:hypothetical protein
VTPLIPNEDVIDLFDRAKPGATVVALASGRSAWMGPIAGPRERQFDNSGSKLTLASAPTKDLAGQDIIFVVTYERAE